MILYIRIRTKSESINQTLISNNFKYFLNIVLNMRLKQVWL